MEKKNVKKLVYFEGIPFLLVLLIDQGTKYWAANFLGSLDFGILHFRATFNHGVFLGYLGHIPTSTKIVVLSTLGAFIICAYVFARLILPMRSIALKSGLAFLTAGILGNVLDRMRGTGGVLDFIYVQSADWMSPIWNVADMFQILGHGLIIVGVAKDSKYFWNNQELRKNFWVESRFQTRFCLNLIAVAFAVGLMNSVMSYAFLKTTLDSVMRDSTTISHTMYSYLAATTLLQICLILMVTYVAKRLSAKIAGPLYAIKRFLSTLLSGQRGVFKLREHDEFKDMEPILNEIADRLAPELPPDLPPNLP